MNAVTVADAGLVEPSQAKANAFETGRLDLGETCRGDFLGQIPVVRFEERPEHFLLGVGQFAGRDAKSLSVASGGLGSRGVAVFLGGGRGDDRLFLLRFVQRVDQIKCELFFAGERARPLAGPLPQRYGLLPGSRPETRRAGDDAIVADDKV